LERSITLGTEGRVGKPRPRFYFGYCIAPFEELDAAKWPLVAAVTEGVPDFLLLLLCLYLRMSGRFSILRGVFQVHISFSFVHNTVFLNGFVMGETGRRRTY
jgi:hypothetical protein